MPEFTVYLQTSCEVPVKVRARSVEEACEKAELPDDLSECVEDLEFCYENFDVVRVKDAAGRIEEFLW